MLFRIFDTMATLDAGGPTQLCGGTRPPRPLRLLRSSPVSPRRCRRGLSCNASEPIGEPIFTLAWRNDCTIDNATV